jgi:imidazolonepropionase
MTPEEVLLGATVHAARSLGMEAVAGCLRPGSFADLTLFDVGAVEEIPYHVGVNRAVMTVVGGRRWCSP